MFNKELYIRECMVTVLGQTLQDIEVICVDDGSTDTSIGIVESFHDPRVRIIRKANSGVGDSRNVGIDAATGKYVCFMDPDDLYPDNDVLRLMFETAESNGAKVCGGSFSSLRDGAVCTSFTGINGGYTFQESGSMKYSDYAFDYGFHRFIYLREMLDSNGIRFPNYIRFQDPPFFTAAMVAAGEFYALKEVTYRYREAYRDIEWTFTKRIDNLKGMLDCIVNGKEIPALGELVVDRLVSPYYEDLLTRNASRFECIAVRRMLDRIMTELDPKQAKRVKALAEKVMAVASDEKPRLFTVIVPVYNVSRYIRDCLDSVLRQDFRDYECICVDDGTPDDSACICEEYAAMDPRFKVVHRFNGGLSNARNTGMDFANGKYLYFLDSDDMIADNALSRMYRVMENHALDALFFDADTIYDNPSIMEGQGLRLTYTDRMPATGPVKGSELLRSFLECDGLRYPVQLSAVRREWFMSHGMECYPKILHEDNLYTVRLMEFAERVEYIPERLFIRRVREGSIMTVGKTIRNFKGYLKVYTELLSDIRECSDPVTLENLIVVKNRIVHTTGLIYEGLSQPEKEKINELDENDRVSMALEPPFPRPACWKKKNLLTLLTISPDAVEYDPGQTLWDSEYRFERGEVDLSCPAELNRFLDTLESGFTSKYIIAVGEKVTDPRFCARCLMEFGKNPLTPLAGVLDGIRYMVCNNTSYVPMKEIVRDTSRDDVLVSLPEDMKLEIVNSLCSGAMAAMYRDGTQIEKDLRRAVSYYRVAAKYDSTKYVELCQILLDSSNPEDRAEAVRLCHEHVADNVKVRNMLSNMYREGIGVEKDIAKAISILEEYGAKGDDHRIIDLLWKSGENDEKMYGLINSCVNKKEAFGYGYMARLYRDGRCMGQDLHKAHDNMAKAADGGISWAADEVLGILWKIGTDAAYREMAIRADKSSTPTSKIYLGRAYRDGKGVDADLEKAAYNLRLGAGDNTGWRLELANVLLSIGTEESCAEAISIIGEYPDEPESNYRMGMAYRDGKGVKADAELAEKYFRKAVHKGDRRALRELVDILWKNDDPSVIRETVKHIENLVKIGDPWGYVYLSRVYRRGRGLEKDLMKSVSYMEKGMGKNVGLICELFDTYWEIGTLPAKRKAAEVILSIKDSNNSRVKDRLNKIKNL
ncbi:MAG: glycosyltransferase [archaeon]|nr:glycosyltransferase [archaeon]